MKTVRDIWRHGNVQDLMIADKNYNIANKYPVVSPDLIVGLELEIEEWNGGPEPSFRGFNFTSDGSLRGESIEAITRPTKLKYVPDLLQRFFSNYEITPDNYSDRCSIHVHVNCHDFSIGQVRNICLVYQVIERVLFDWIGEDREQNIFCIPWYQCNISNRFVYRFLTNADDTVRRWQKYTALNILPIRERGTIEFRHLYGTCNLVTITTWLNIIASIISYATNQTYNSIKETIVNMNSVSNYESFIDNVFGSYSMALKASPNYTEALIRGVVDTKIALADSELVKEDVDQPTPAQELNARLDAMLAEINRITTPVAAPVLVRDYSLDEQVRWVRQLDDIVDVVSDNQVDAARYNVDTEEERF